MADIFLQVRDICHFPVHSNSHKHLKLGSIETHVADARTCCLHPASATHRQMNDEELTACGVYPDLVRYSCGLEDAEDLIADLEQAFAQI